MESEYCFELNFSNSFERRFLLNNGEYIMKYTSDYNISRGYYACNSYVRLTLERKADIPSVVMVDIYRMNSDSKLFSRWKVLQANQITFDLNFTGAGYDLSSGTYLCYIKAVRYEKWQKFQESAKKGATTTNVTSSKGAIVERRYENLSSDMNKLLTQGEFFDVILTDGSTDFRAHKLVLSARSPVFSKMFQHPMKEKNENLVSISDISSEVLKELLTFIYTGVATIKDMKMARELYVAADKYDVKELKGVCSKYLNDVDLSSVLDTLTLASLYGDDVLKQFALEFIAKNYSEVKAQKSWGSFMKKHQVLALEVLSFVLDKKN